VQITPFGSGIETTALVMKNSPTVMSMGKRCMREGYSFRWDAGCKPLLVPPDGEEIVLDVINGVLILPMNRQGYAGAAPKASSSSGKQLEETSSTEDAPTTKEESLGEESPTQTLGELSPTKDAKIPDEHFLTHLPKHPKFPA
jgi:hypothetical protein